MLSMPSAMILIVILHLQLHLFLKTAGVICEDALVLIHESQTEHYKYIFKMRLH